VPAAPPAYDFAHAIVRHTLYSELNPDRRTRLHRRIAVALAETSNGEADDQAGEVAAQFHASASLPGASAGLSYALAAAERARAGAALEQAVSFLRMARDLAAEGGTAARAQVLCRLAVAEAEAMWLDAARRSADQALDALAAANADPGQTAEFLATVARALQEGGAAPAAWTPLLERGLALLGATRTLTWARLMLLRERFEPVSHGIIHTSLGLGYDPQAVAIARAAGDEEDYARTLTPFDWWTRDENDALLALVRTWRRPSAAMRALSIVARGFC
jgi:hypothetical protein